MRWLNEKSMVVSVFCVLQDVEYERARVVGCNILICTPGRLLQHMDETPYFDVDQLKVLGVLFLSQPFYALFTVLDEADRILDMGFRKQMDAIIEHFSSAQRQTMLFSATQTK